VSGPDDDRTVELSTGEQPVVEQPSVRTAPAPSRIQRWWASVPPHVGPARTSTVVLAVLFLALGSLYLTVRPEPAPVVAVQTTTPAATTARTKVPATSTPAGTTTETPTPTTVTTTVPTSGPTTGTPSATTTTETPTGTVVPTTEVPTTAPTTTEPPAPTS
jgi:hypothetical protein